MASYAPESSPLSTSAHHMRLLFVAKWFMEYFLCERTRQSEEAHWRFRLVATVIDRGWIVWVLRHMREAQEEKPKLWTELQAGIECLTQSVLVLDIMASAPPSRPPTDADGSVGPDLFASAETSAEEDVADASRTLQQQIVYNSEVLDIAFESMRTYKEGTQSLAYLAANVHLAYALLRMLERWGKRQGKGEMYVRKKAKPKKKRGAKSTEEGEGVPDVEEEPQQREEEEVVNETMFTFDQFEQRFVHVDVTHTLLVYLARYKEFSGPEQMKRIVSMMHRQAVRRKAEGLYLWYPRCIYSSRLWRTRSRSRRTSRTYLVALITFIRRKFFKAIAEDSFVIVEVFFPKNRGHWQQFSSIELDQVGPRPEGPRFDDCFPVDVTVKKGYSLSDQIGIAIAAPVEKDQRNLVEWTKQILLLAIVHRRRIIDHVDGAPSQAIDLAAASDSEDDLNPDTLLGRRPPSAEALAKINDYLIPYVSDEEAEAANKNPQLKLLFRLCSFKIMEEDADELEWYIPSVVLPADMQGTVNVITQFLETPLDLQGRSPAELLARKRRRRTRRKRTPTPNPDDSDAPPRKKKERKKKEAQQYKSAQFIEDSDTGYGDMDAFLEREKSGTMRAHGTRKRRRKAKDGAGKKRRKRAGQEGVEGDGDEAGKARESSASSDESEVDVFGSPKRARSESTPDTSPPPMGGTEEQPKSKPRRRPRARAKAGKSSVVDDTEVQPSARSPLPANKADDMGAAESARSPSPAQSDDDLPTAAMLKGKRKARMVITDEDEDE
ncbi:hypothetical protein VTO73DRAFT_13977 [Trametes versicolor]